MNQFIEECRREWRRLRVPRSIADDMAAELQSDLAEAVADGVAPEDVVGGDARAFARTWAAERGAARTRRREAFVIAAIALFVAIAITGAALVFFASPSQSVQTALPRALVARPSPAPSPETVTAVWVAAPDLATERSGDGTRTAGIALLLVGVGGSAAVTLFSVWRTRAALWIISVIKPPPLREGGTIGVAAASSPFENRSEIDRGVRWYEQRGYRVKLAPGVYARDDYVAGDARARANDVTALFADDEVDVVQMLRGGYGASQVVPLLDYDVIAANPKPFVGYSDVTALHVAIRQRTGLVTFYGLGLTSMGAPKRQEGDKEWFMRAMTTTEPLGEVPARPDDPYIGALGSGRATAPLVGGCLWLLRETLGAPWEIELGDVILFFEDVHAPPWHVDGMLTQLHNSRKLERVKGIAIGEMYKSDASDQLEPWLRSRSMEDVFEHHLEPLGIPILHNLPLGHGKHLWTLPLGVTATIDADARTLTIDEAALDASASPAERAASR